MISVDTNVLIRVFVDDPTAKDQIKKVRGRLARESRVFICQPVQIETAWVLKRCYSFAKAELLLIFGELLQNHAFEVEQETIFQSALNIFKKTNIEFADAMILAISRTRELPILTFDKKLMKQRGAIGFD